MIELRGFGKNFGQIVAVDDVSLEIGAGETFALVGPNGSGKSTIIRALAGLLTPSRGKILIDGRDSHGDRRDLGQAVAYVPQRVLLPGLLTGREVVTFYAGLRKIDPQLIDPMLERVGLADSADRFVREFSGGMAQRLGLGIALLGETPVLVLDEPTANLDADGIQLFRELVGEARARGTTTFFSSHIIQDALELADRVGVLVEGRLVSTEPVEKLHDRLALETTVRVTLARTDPTLQAAIEKAGAVESHINGSSLSFRAPPSRRLQILRAIEASGGSIEALYTEMPSWENLLKSTSMVEEP